VAGQLYFNTTTGQLAVYDGATWDVIASGANGLLQTQFAEVTANTTTASTTFVDLLTVTLTTTAGSALLINFGSSSSNTTASRTNAFRVTVDGVAKRGAAARITTVSEAAGAVIVQKVTGLAAGSHTVKVQWRVTSSSTAQIRPVASPDTEYAALLVKEVTV
jgi:uncharacterized membrane protein